MIAFWHFREFWEGDEISNLHQHSTAQHKHTIGLHFTLYDTRRSEKN